MKKFYNKIYVVILEFDVQTVLSYLTEAGQISPKPNRPKVKSAPSQIGPSQIGLKSNRPQVKSAPVKSAPFLLFTIYCQHAKLNSITEILLRVAYTVNH